MLTITTLLPSTLFVNERAKAIEMPPLKPPQVSTAKFKRLLSSLLLKTKKAGSNEIYLADKVTTINIMRPLQNYRE